MYLIILNTWKNWKFCTWFFYTKSMGFIKMIDPETYGILRLIVSKFLIDLESLFKPWDPVLILVKISCCKALKVRMADMSVDGARSSALLAWGRASEGLLRASMARDMAYAHSNAFGRSTDARAAKSNASDGSCYPKKRVCIFNTILKISYVLKIYL